jgi:hypothetical protein
VSELGVSESEGIGLREARASAMMRGTLCPDGLLVTFSKLWVTRGLEPFSHPFSKGVWQEVTKSD